LRQRKRWLLAQFAPAPDGLRASLVERFSRCGKANCHCQRDGPKHGPFYFLTQCLAVGRSTSFSSNLRPAAGSQEGIAHFRRLQELMEELSQINAELLRRDESLTDE